MPDHTCPAESTPISALRKTRARRVPIGATTSRFTRTENAVAGKTAAGRNRFVHLYGATERRQRGTERPASGHLITAAASPGRQRCRTTPGTHPRRQLRRGGRRANRSALGYRPVPVSSVHDDRSRLGWRATAQSTGRQASISVSASGRSGTPRRRPRGSRLTATDAGRPCGMRVRARRSPPAERAALP